MRTTFRPRPAPRFRPAPLIAAIACAFGTTLAPAAIFTVESTFDPFDPSDPPKLTLRAAIEQVNAQPDCSTTGGHIIQFGGPFTVNTPIQLQSSPSELPPITCNNVEIRGEGKVLLEPHPFYGGGIGCALLATPPSGLTKISGMTIRNFAYGSGLCGSVHATGNYLYGNQFGLNLAQGTVESNYIGTPDGVTALGNEYGVYVSEGGDVTLTDNLVSGNSNYGIYLIFVGNVTITGNKVGTDSLGSAQLSNSSSGIYVDSASSATITGNLVSGNFGTGIELWNAGSLVVQGNKVGTDASGTAALGNAFGIDVYFSYGGQIDGNTISGNSYGGLYLSNADATISNNKVGTDISGTSQVQNGGIGIELNGFSGTGTVISNNVVSGNGDAGISLCSADNATISGNKIGTDVTGNAGIANGLGGIDACFSDMLSIIGNQISANGMYGGMFFGVTNSLIEQNLIGTKADGSALSNNGPGLQFEGFGCQLAFSATDIGPKVATSGDGNVIVDNLIAHNNGDGILLVTGATGNTITATGPFGGIHSNNGKNINLDFYGGPRPNDSPDGTYGGPNFGQNTPLILSAIEDSGSTVVQFSLHSFPKDTWFVNDFPFNGQFTIDLYGNLQAGVPAGQKWVGQVTVFTDSTGNVTHTTTLPGVGHGHITATATGPYGTSEFSGTLTALVPSASITLANVAFNNVVVGATATDPTEIQFRSNGTGDYVIDSISEGASAPTCPASPAPVCSAGDFSCSVSCTTATPYPPLLLPTDPPSCKITGLSFHPTAPGFQSKKLWICDNTSPTARPIELTGTGVPHVVTASQSFHDFGNVSLGTQAVSPNITLTNAAGNPPATLGAPTVSAPFSVDSTDCGPTLAPGASCNLKIGYAPAAVGTDSGALTMTVANGNAVTISLQGTGTAAPLGQLNLPAGVDMGSAVLAGSPLTHAVTMTNSGNAPVNFSSIAATAPFELAHDCPASLSPSASCTATLGFDPLVYGNSSGQLTVASDASGAPHVVTLLATVNAVSYGVSPATSNYGSVPVGSSSAPRTFIISNNGDRPIPLAEVSTAGPFSVAESDCGTELPARSSCTAQVTFDPAQAGSASGMLAATVGLSGAPQAVAELSGNGTQSPALALPSEVDFGAIVLGSVTAVTRAVELRNTGNAVLTFSTSVEGPFTLSGNCGLNLAPGASCQVILTFTPSALGEFNGSLSVVSNAPGGSRAIALRARVQPQLAPLIRVSPAAIGFGDRMQGSLSEPQQVTVRNEGGLEATLNILASPNFALANSLCGTTLAPGASCTLQVQFLPLRAGVIFGSLSVNSNSTGSPHVVELLGRGCQPYSMMRRGQRPSC